MSDFAPGPLRVSRLVGGFTEDFETSTAARKNFWFGRIDPGISRLCPKASLGFGGKPLSYFDINCAARVAATWMRLKKKPGESRALDQAGASRSMHERANTFAEPRDFSRRRILMDNSFLSRAYDERLRGAKRRRRSRAVARGDRFFDFSNKSAHLAAAGAVHCGAPRELPNRSFGRGCVRH